MSPYFYLFGREIPWYGVLFAGSLLLSGLLAAVRGKQRGIGGFDAAASSCYAGIGGIAGAKLLSVATSWKIIAEYDLSFLEVLQNGFVFYGGLIGGFLGLLLYCRIYHLPYADFLDVFAVRVPLGHAIGRVGCFLSGCCYGVPYDGFPSVVYTAAADPNTPLGVPLFAVQLVESACLLLLYLALELLFHRSKKGTCAFVYLFAYAFIRFVLEFFRGDPIRGGAFGLSTSQIISLLLAAAGLIVLLVLRRRGKRETRGGIVEGAKEKGPEKAAAGLKDAKD